MFQRIIYYILLCFIILNLNQCNSDDFHDEKKNKYIVLSVIFGTASHAKSMLYIGEEMVKRGHEVIYMPTTITREFAKGFNISTVPLKTPEYRHTSKEEEEKETEQLKEKLIKFRTSLTADVSIARSIATVFNRIADDTYEKAVFGLLDAFQKRKPNLVICDFMGMACADVCAHLNIPYMISIVSLAHIGHPELPTYIPDQHIGRSVFSITFFQRFYDKFIFNLQLFTFVFPGLKKMNQIRSKYGLPTYFNPQTNLINRPVLITSFDGWTVPHVRSPLIHIVGPVIQEKELQKQIPHDLLQWLEDARSLNKPVIYVAFGSIAVLTRAHIKILLNSFSMDSSSYRILWSLGGLSKEQFPVDIIKQDNKYNIRFEQWVPQLKVLAHPAVKLFITHGGIESIHEILYIGKPSIMIPLFGDQFGNAILARDRGLGGYLDKKTMTSNDVSKMVHQLIDNYENHSSQLYHNLDKMRRIVQYNLNNYKQIYNALEMEMDVGSEHLIPVSVSWIIAYDIDIWLTFIILVAILICIPRIVYKTCCGNKTKEKVKNN